MPNPKHEHKAPPRRKKPGAEAIASAGGTLESAVLAMLVRADAKMEVAFTGKTTQKVLKPGLSSKFKISKIKGYAPNQSIGLAAADPKKLTALQGYSKKLYLGLAQHGLIESKTIRFRRKSKGLDRKFVVETSIDPLDGTSVLLRVRPMSDAKFPAGKVVPQMLTTQQAAAELNVSRPYVVELVNKSTFKGVAVTGGGHRRIPAIEVERVRKEMQVGMRKGIDAIMELTEGESSRELDDAKKGATRRWAART